MDAVTPPTPSSLSTARVGEIEALARAVQDLHAEHTPDIAWHEANEFATRGFAVVCGELIAACDPQTILALCARSRDTSRDSERLDWLEQHGEMLTRPQFPPHWEIKPRGQSWIRGHETSTLRRLIDAARTPQESTTNA